MATSAETHEPKGIKKAWTNATAKAKDRIKVVEKAWTDTKADMNTRVQTAEKDVREFIKKVEDESKERFESLKSTFHMEDLFKRMSEQGQKLSQEALDRLGLTTKAELEAVSAELGKLADKVEGLRKKLNDVPTKSVVETLKKQVDKIAKAQAH